jgi:hypothetical protein
MTEMEERLLKLGFPLVDEKDDGACCEDDLQKDMQCAWSVETVELPDAKPPELASSAGSMMGPGSSGPGSSGLGPLSALTQLAANPPSADAGLAGLASTLQEGSGGVDMIAQLVMSFVYPRLKPMLEASIRKLTVTVKWKEGIRARDLTIVQYFTYPTQGGLLPPGAAPSGTATSPGTPRPAGT